MKAPPWIEPCTQIVIIDKKTGKAEITYLNGRIVIEGTGDSIIRIATPSNHFREDVFDCVLSLAVEGEVTIKPVES